MANGQGSFNKWLGDFPSQQGLAALVILMWAATCIVMLAGKQPADGWIPALDTVTFAAVMHYGIKRWSYKSPTGLTQEADVDPSTPPTAPEVG